ncbi:MAG: hypothetical protein ACXVZV_02450 [Terriglobales bacterium]
MGTPSVSNGNVLNSWKEIASHLGRGVRTVQRWERDLGMPVRRPGAKSRSAVIAIADELDAWLRSAPTGDLIVHQSNPTEASARLQTAMEQHASLRDRCLRLRNANTEALAKLASNLEQLQRSLLVGQQIKASMSSVSPGLDA